MGILRWIRNHIIISMVSALIISSALGIWAFVEYIAWKVPVVIQAECLKKTLDAWLIRKKIKEDPESIAMFRQKVIAGIQVHRNRVAQKKEFFCPPANLVGKWERARLWLLGSSKTWKSSPRHVVIDEEVNKAFVRGYQPPLPAHLLCINEYVGSNMRVIKRVRLFIQGERPVESIGTMRLYCR